jgi:hypothetical protein
MRNQTQNDTILTHLRKFGRINSIEAIRRYGITRISACIYDLRKRGIVIKSEASVTAHNFVDYVMDVEGQRLRDANLLRESVSETTTFNTIETEDDLRNFSHMLTNSAVEATRIVNTR